MDADGILDTSALSEEEETVLDEAMEMHPELIQLMLLLMKTIQLLQEITDTKQSNMKK